MKKKISILITTKNRLTDLKITLANLAEFIIDSTVECMVYDDASSDGTYSYVKENFPKIILLRNEKSLGLIHNRNVLLNNCSGEYAISLDDDAHFITENPLEIIESYFRKNPVCGVLAFRIFWHTNNPTTTQTNEVAQRVKGFVGCGHAWRMAAWKAIPDYPEWFVFYGEEEFASYQLFKKAWEVHYVPEVLIHHRVDVKSRKKNKDYTIRLRRSLRSGWYLYILFYPLQSIPKKLVYSVWMQLKLKVFKGDLKAGKAMMMAFFDFGLLLSGKK